ncbi:MAG: hypothetical protein ACOZNI_09075 [Myxococcota bacterium]
MPSTLDTLLDGFRSRVATSAAGLPFWLYKEHDLRRDFIEATRDLLGSDAVADVTAMPVETEVGWGRKTEVRAVDLRVRLDGIDHWIEFKHWNGVLKTIYARGALRLRVGNRGWRATVAHLERVRQDVEKLERLTTRHGGRALLVSLFQDGRATEDCPPSVLEYTGPGADSSRAWREPLFGGMARARGWSEEPSGWGAWHGRFDRIRFAGKGQGRDFVLFVHAHRGDGVALPETVPVHDDSSDEAPANADRSLTAEEKAVVRVALSLLSRWISPPMTCEERGGKYPSLRLRWVDGACADLFPQRKSVVIETLWLTHETHARLNAVTGVRATPNGRKTRLRLDSHFDEEALGKVLVVAWDRPRAKG